MHRKTRNVLGLGVFLLTFSAATPFALAEPITGTPENDVLLGTPQQDTIHGLAGEDNITPGKGNDRAFGDEGTDAFYWTSGDGQDRLDGGPNTIGYDTLQIIAGNQLRLHIDALNAGALTIPKNDLQVLGINGIEVIQVTGTAGDDRLVLSSDPGIHLRINCGLGSFHVDASNVGSETEIECYGSAGSNLVRGSRKFFDVISVNAGNNEIWTGRGGSNIFLAGGKDKVHLGKGQDRIGLRVETTSGAKVVTAFEADDIFDLYDIRSDFPNVLDTNGDGRLDAKDRTVKVRNGNMTIDLTATLHGAVTSVTLIGHTRVSMDRFIVDCGC